MVSSIKPLVSVIIPVYNREKEVLKTLNNIKGNDYRPIELILVDDGSEDGVPAVLRNFENSAQDENFIVKIISQSNQGTPTARNRGYKKSTGAYIQFLDSDDLIDSQKFGIQIDMMKRQNPDFGLCDFTMLYVRDQKSTYCSNAEKLRKVLRATESFGCGSPLLHRNLADKLEWNTALRKKQDVDYFLRAALLANGIAYVDRSLYTYVRNETDHNRISASYTSTPPAYRRRITSIFDTKVPKDKKHHKQMAIASLRWYWLKHTIKSMLFGNKS
jgi:glycosyltransferase involved in cell wall biosynthesis